MKNKKQEKEHKARRRKQKVDIRKNPHIFIIVKHIPCTGINPYEGYTIRWLPGEDSKHLANFCKDSYIWWVPRSGRSLYTNPASNGFAQTQLPESQSGMTKHLHKSGKANLLLIDQ